MRVLEGISLEHVRAVYSGPEGDLWELIMGEQIHLGGFASSMALAERADIAPGTVGVDLGCCTGAGMRFLIRFRNVARMVGVDATPRRIGLGRRRCADQGLADRIEFREADVCDTGLPAASVDFIWGEDAWCYVIDKPRLVTEATRLLRPGGIMAFTDWLEGPTPLTDTEAARFLAFMKFPCLASLRDYRTWLAANGCTVIAAEDTGRFAPCIDLYLEMLNRQLTYDTLRILNFDLPLMEQLGAELEFTRQLVHGGKLIQGQFVAHRR
jgi:SAM-dependent methyltransferase